MTMWDDEQQGEAAHGAYSSCTSSLEHSLCLPAAPATFALLNTWLLAVFVQDLQADPGLVAASGQSLFQ
jgi:hypothetical protein